MVYELKAGPRELLRLYWTGKWDIQSAEVLCILNWEKAPFSWLNKK